MQIDVAQIWKIKIFFNNITDIIMRDFFCFHDDNENEAVETHIPRHRDSKTKKPRHRDSKTKKPQHWDFTTKKPRHRDSAIKTPRHGQTETNKPQHRDSKTFFQRTKSHDIQIPRLKNHAIKIPRPKTHDIEFEWGNLISRLKMVMLNWNLFLVAIVRKCYIILSQH